MRIAQWDPADEQTARACHDITVAAQLADEPVEPPPSFGVFSLYLRQGWEKTPGETWVATDEGGTVTGFYRITLPDLENLDSAFGGPVVPPALRRRGTGRALLRHAGTRAAAHGRTLYRAVAAAGSAGQAFAERAGARLDQEEMRRIQYLRDIAPGTVADLRASAAAAANGYSLVSWAGPVPDEYLDGLAGVINAFADAPHGENEEPEVWDAARIRERGEAFMWAGLMRSHSVVAIRDADGEMAAYTEVIVDPERPDWGYQQLTAVTRTHRGHRLGLLVKTAMLDLLAAEEPKVERIATGNAAANEHMIAINEQLGYRVVEPGWRFYEMPVAALASV
jgi:RimJ/RimL family protein N-acetyltransferase